MTFRIEILIQLIKGHRFFDYTDWVGRIFIGKTHVRLLVQDEIMSKDYIVIADSIPTRTKRFRVIQGGWKVVGCGRF